MSEYQRVHFQAVDRPLTDEQLKFAQRQSSRAEVSRWSLSVEYHYSEFRGDVDGLLRRGYDVYVQYTNYGSRKIKIRLPGGLPCPKSVWSQYVDSDQLQWSRDARGPAGILTLKYHDELGDLEPWDSEPCVEAVIQLRDRLIQGDLRALYVLWLCAAFGSAAEPTELVEPPVPHGLAEVGDYGEELLYFFGVEPLLLIAAGNGVAPAPGNKSEKHMVDHWVKSLGEQQAKEALLNLLTADTASEKARLLATIRDSQTSAGWPTTHRQQTLNQLLLVAAELRAKAQAKLLRQAQAAAKRQAAQSERQRAQRLDEMRQAPDKWLREAAQLVQRGGTQNYRAVAEILDDLRAALGGNEGNKLARRHAATLVKQHPTLNLLKSSLRKRGLLD